MSEKPELICGKCARSLLVGDAGGPCPNCGQVWYLPDSILEDTKKIKHTIVSHLFAQAIAAPHPVNAEVSRDYEAIAMECVRKSDEATRYLLRELGMV
jgi:hypothetical protein